MNRLEPKVKTSDKGFYKDLMYSRWSSKKDPLIRSHPYEPDRFYLHHHCDAFSTSNEFQQLLRLAQTRGRSRRFQSLKKRWMQIRYIFGMPRKAYSWQDMTGHDRTWQMWSICPICSAQLFQRKFPKPAGVCQAREIFRKAMPSSTPSFLQAGSKAMSNVSTGQLIFFAFPSPMSRSLRL